MPAPYTDNTFTTAKQDGPTRVSFPFLNWPTKDNTCRQYTQDMVVLPGSFAPLAALSTWPGDGTFAANANIYLVEETDPTADLGAYRFQRVYSSVPATQNTYSSLLIVRPNLHGYQSGANWAVSFDDGETAHRWNTRTSVTTARIGTGGYVGDVLVTHSSHGRTAGDRYALWSTNTLAAYGQVAFINNADSYIVAVEDFVGPASENVCTAIAFAANAVARYVQGPIAISTKEVHRFYLPGVTPGITTPEDIPLNSAQTDPVSWFDLIVAGTSLGVVKGSELQVWKGPIYEQVTIYGQMSDALETVSVNA